jgi:hypothetical protein
MANDMDKLMSKTTLFNQIKEYVDGLETNLTAENCLCEWIRLDNGRKVKSHVHPECPVHTREGLILHFVITVLHPEDFKDDEPIVHF